jgi:hypothetical protein
MKYKSEEVEKLSIKLNKEANRLIISHVLRGFLKGGLLAAAIFMGFRIYQEYLFSQNSVSSPDSYYGIITSVLVFLLCLLGGYSAGKREAFMIQVQAHSILCFTQIEKNTRTD